MALKFNNALIVDDIRIEINGKWILIGYYTGDIIIPNFPAPFVFQLTVEIEGLNKGVHEIAMRATAGDAISEFSGSLEIAEESKAIIPSPKLAIVFSEPSVLRVECSADGSEPVVIVEKNVLQGNGLPDGW